MSADRLKVTVGVCGGIAAYKAVELVRQLQDAGLDPHVVMTDSAQRFVTPLTFAAISGHKVISSLWTETAGATQEGPSAGGNNPEAPSTDGTAQPIEHIAEAQNTHALIIVPATANTVARLAHGLADDFLTTLYLATTAPVILAPAMNVVMWNHPATQANLTTLRQRGVHIVEPGSGYLACGMTGSGRLAELPSIVAATLQVLAATAPAQCDFSGETVVITAGGTREAIDPVRFIGNRSSGRMGYALAEAALERGAKVILISAPASLLPPSASEFVPVVSAADMRSAVMKYLPQATLLIMAAAVSDFTPRHPEPRKIKRSGPLFLELEPTPDILAEAALHRSPATRIIAFAAETDSDALIQNALAKLDRKGADAIVANDVSLPGQGFDSERNAGIFITHDHQIEIPATTKKIMAHRILDEALTLRSAPALASLPG